MREDEFNEILRVQQMMSQRLMQEQRTDKKIDLLNMINELAGSGSGKVQMEAVLLEASMNGMTDRQVNQIIDDLVNDHLIKRAGSYIQLT